MSRKTNEKSAKLVLPTYRIFKDENLPPNNRNSIIISITRIRSRFMALLSRITRRRRVLLVRISLRIPPLRIPRIILLRIILIGILRIVGFLIGMHGFFRIVRFLRRIWIVGIMMRMMTTGWKTWMWPRGTRTWRWCCCGCGSSGCRGMIGFYWVPLTIFVGTWKKCSY